MSRRDQRVAHLVSIKASLPVAIVNLKDGAFDYAFPVPLSSTTTIWRSRRWT